MLSIPGSSSRRTSTLVLLIAFSLLPSVAGCQEESGEFYGVTRPRHGVDEFWYNLGSDPEWLDPGLATDSASGVVLLNLFSGLVQLHPQTLEPMPDIAEDWQILDEGRRYRFVLRKSVWSDGVSVTAHDFVFAFQRVLNPDTGSRYANFLFPILNAKAVNEGNAEPQELGVKALSDRLLEIRLEKPVPYFLSVLAFYTSMPVPRHVLRRLEARGIDPGRWTRPEHIVSNGAYVLKRWRFRRDMLLEKNSRYWDVSAVKMKRVKLLMVDSYNTTLNLYKAGELDHIGQSSLPSEFMDYLSRFKDFRRGKSLSVYLLWLNVKRPPLDDVRVRKALSLAIDRRALVRHVTRGGQIPSADLVPDGLAGYHGLGLRLFDPERARALLREAGYSKDHPLPPITYKYNTSEGHKQIAEAIQQMWKKQLGIDARIENEEWRVYLKSLETRNFQVGRLGWVADYADPNTFLELLLSNNGNNHSNWGNPRVDQVIELANNLSNKGERLAKLRQAEALALSAQPMIPLYVYTRSELVKPYVRGAYMNYQSRDLFKYVTIDSRYYQGVPEPLPEFQVPLRKPRSASTGERRLQP